jgi:hypothetical protein
VICPLAETVHKQLGVQVAAGCEEWHLTSQVKSVHRICGAATKAARVKDSGIVDCSKAGVGPPHDRSHGGRKLLCRCPSELSTADPETLSIPAASTGRPYLLHQQGGRCHWGSSRGEVLCRQRGADSRCCCQGGSQWNRRVVAGGTGAGHCIRRRVVAGGAGGRCCTWLRAVAGGAGGRCCTWLRVGGGGAGGRCCAGGGLHASQVVRGGARCV